jgi:hypothetical protein
MFFDASADYHETCGDCGGDGRARQPVAAPDMGLPASVAAAQADDLRKAVAAALSEANRGTSGRLILDRATEQALRAALQQRQAPAPDLLRTIERVYKEADAHSGDRIKRAAYFSRTIAEALAQAEAAPAPTDWKKALRDLVRDVEAGVTDGDAARDARAMLDNDDEEAAPAPTADQEAS